LWVPGLIERSLILNLSEIEALLHKFLKFLKSEVTPKTAFFNRETGLGKPGFHIKKCRFWGHLRLQEFQKFIQKCFNFAQIQNQRSFNQAWYPQFLSRRDLSDGVAALQNNRVDPYTASHT
jgi:hypothetical protein